MCENHSAEENAFILKMAKLNRRQFGKLGATAALSMMLPPIANAAARPLPMVIPPEMTTGSFVLSSIWSASPKAGLRPWTWPPASTP